MISQGIAREIIQTLEPIVLSKCHERTHKLSTTHFFLCTQSFNSFRSWLGKLMHWEWRGMVINFILRQAISMENHVFSCVARKQPEIGAHSIPHPCVSLPHAVGASWVFFLHVFCNFPSSFHGRKPVFELHSGWEEGFTI